MADELSSALNQLSKQIATVNSNVVLTNTNILVAQGQIVITQKEVEVNRQRIAELQRYVAQFRKEQQKLAALQRAITEIVRVNQDYAKMFGKYEEVRNNMLGILQSTSKNLVKTETINRIAEELLLATPGYWLSPCVVALSAWISGDSALVQRALDEALARNADNTALLMALVCRRNGCAEAGNAWLMFYLKRQSANKISRGLMLFINAYVNGLFGAPDSRVDDIVNYWIEDLAGGGDGNSAQFKDFESRQKENWKKNFIATKDGNVRPMAESIPNLLKFSKDDLSTVCEYIDRQNTTPIISNYFDKIINFVIDDKERDEIGHALDEYLMNLASDVDPEEVSLKQERDYYLLVKKYEGDEVLAKKQIEREREKREKYLRSVNFMDLLEESAAGYNDEGTKNESERRIAVKFTKKYIQGGYDEFIDESKVPYPNKVSATVCDIKSDIKGRDEQTSFIQKIKDKFEQQKAAELAAIKPGAMFILGIIMLAAGLIFSVVFAISKNGVAVVTVGVAVVGLVMMVLAKKKEKERKSAVIKTYDDLIASGTKTVIALTNEFELLSASIAKVSHVEKFNIMTRI